MPMRLPATEHVDSPKPVKHVAFSTVDIGTRSFTGSDTPCREKTSDV